MEEAQGKRLLDSLLRHQRETEWVEFKENDAEPKEIGEYLSALSNAAALHHEKAGYIVWGIKDAARSVVGTTFRPRERKIGNEELENWLHHHLTPRVDFRIHEFLYDGKPLVIFETPPCSHTPVRFDDTEFIRVGTYKKKLRDYPEKERALWSLAGERTFEKGIALAGCDGDLVLARLDYPRFFELMGQNLPSNKDGILERLEREFLIVPSGNDRWDISNLGAVLFAKNLLDFEAVARKAVRVIVYHGKNRVQTEREQQGTLGYAAGFQRLLDYINQQLPQSEEIGRALRREVRLYPELAIRELVANALIHQDFTIRGTGPLIEIFHDRIETTNPGKPLIDTLRFLDEPPQSRNEALAKLMRRLNICEERGTGIDKVISQVELFQLPAPEFRVTENHTIAILYAPRKLTEMEKADKVRACYQHAGLQYVSNEAMTNTTLRKRFGIEERNYSIASRIIADTIAAGLIKPHDPASTSRKLAKYLPYWG